MVAYSPSPPWVGPYPVEVTDSHGNRWEALGPNRLKPEPADCCQRARVYLLAGQSNARGRALLSGLSAANQPFLSPYPPLAYAANHTNPVTGVSSYNLLCSYLQLTEADRLGPEMSLGRCLSEQVYAHGHPCDVPVLIKFTAGGSQMEDWLSSGASPLAGVFQAWLSATMDVLEQKFCKVMCEKMFWVHGETDSNNAGGVAASLYLGRFQQFLSEITQCNFDPVFALVKTNRPISTNTATGANIINTSMINAGYATTSSNDDLALIDNAHYDADSQITLGNRLCAAA